MVSTCILTSKTRVAPMKKQTTPRLELLGATILSRLVHNVQKVLPIQPQVYCWTDSLTVLCWIKNHHQWKQYVQIRVEEICKWVDRDNWRFCPGTENPADIPSRSCTSHELKSSELWWNGPGFLKDTCDRWPDMPTCHESETAKLELVKKPQEIVHSLVSVTNNDQFLDLESVLEIKRYSTKVKLLRVTGTVLKFITLLRSNDRTRISHTLNGTDLNEAEILWIKSIQRSSFPEEYHLLKDGKSVIYKNQFKLFLNEHKVICCEGHLKNADIPTSTKCPVLLPTKHYFTELVIKGCHKTVHHNGISETLASLREKHWIFRGREAVKKIIRKCVVCRRYEGKAYTGPLIPDLPAERVSADPPFNNTGIDFAGPLYIHTAEAKESKAYVCIFTCASTRALHLEVTEGLSANTFLLAFRRFCSRRGIPSIILSDNAKTFKHCAKEIMKIIRSEEVHQYLSNKQITWTFIAEKAPWWGGVWERLVQSVKRCLRKVVGRSTLTLDELTTVITEIETTLNNRPLTYLHDDTEGVSHALTPASLVYGRRIATTPSSRQFEVASTSKTLTKRAKHQYHALNCFVRLWLREYLLSIQERRSIKVARGNSKGIQAGDIVVLKEDGTSRCLWKLAKVTETVEGRDGAIRSAKVQLLSKNKVIQLRRPIQHLVPLEADI